MTGVATIELRTAMVNNYFKRALSVNDQVELCLTGKVPAVNAATNQLDEPSAASYSRPIVGLSDFWWSVAPDGSVYLDQTVLFPTATTAWGYLAGWAIVASLSSGSYVKRVLATGRLVQPVKVAAGIQLRLQPGQVSFALTDGA